MSGFDGLRDQIDMYLNETDKMANMTTDAKLDAYHLYEDAKEA
jgi:hypothetical protein